jgi:hypothetical protein
VTRGGTPTAVHALLSRYRFDAVISKRGMTPRHAHGGARGQGQSRLQAGNLSAQARAGQRPTGRLPKLFSTTANRPNCLEQDTAANTCTTSSSRSAEVRTTPLHPVPGGLIRYNGVANTCWLFSGRTGPILQTAKCAETTADAVRRNCWLFCWLSVAPGPTAFHRFCTAANDDLRPTTNAVSDRSVKDD